MNRIGNIFKKVLTLSCVAALVFSMAACGSGENEGKEDASKAQMGIGGYVYVPEYKSMGGENTYYSNMTFVGSNMYYSNYTWDETNGTGKETYYCKDLDSDTQAQELPVTIPDGLNVSHMVVDEAGNMYFFLMDYDTEKINEYGETVPDVYLYKTDSQGTEIYLKDITRHITEGETYFYIQYAIVDDQGRMYASLEQNICLIDADGNFAGKIQTTDWINGMGMGKDGKVYISQWSNTGSGCLLTELDFEAKALGTVYENFPDGNSGGTLQKGVEHDFIVSDGAKVVGYRLADQSCEDILEWLDSDINGQYVDSVKALDDGRLMAYIRDWDTGESELAFLTRTKVSEVAQKEVIVIGVLSTSQDLQNSAVKFNKSNEKYRVRIKEYLNYDAWTENTYQECITAMNTEIISGNGPDLIDLSSIDIENLASKGLLEDLNQYLERSQTLRKEDFVQSVVKGYTIDHVLTCIPTNFYVSTVMGRTSQVGEEMGWSVAEMMAFLDANPDVEAFDSANKNSMLQYCMMFNRKAFVDEVSGTCHFDSEEFKQVLEFVNRFPDDYEYDPDAPSGAKKLMEGMLLLNTTSIEDPESFSVQLEMFGKDPVTCIGFPTVDGSIGNAMYADNAYGILSTSQKKEGAWEFIEFMLKPQSSVRTLFRYGFSARADEFEEMVDSSTKVRYILDENGEPFLDEEGNPIEQGYGGWGWGDITIEARALTEEEAQMLRDVVASASPIFGASGNDEIMNIIVEEAAAYFSGQKSVEDVASIIQSKVKILISENR